MCRTHFTLKPLSRQTDMLRSGKQRSANDTTLSDRELRKVEADGVVLEQKLETLREQQEEREEDLKEYVFTCTICYGLQADEPLDALLGPCGHRFHAGCWELTRKTLKSNYKRAQKRAKMQKDLGVPDAQQPIKADFIRCPRCLVSVDWVADLTGMGAPGE